MTNLTLDEKKELIRMALKAREGAYVPYSDFMVGAALRAEDGRIFTGCNVENAAFTPTSCAERTALLPATLEGPKPKGSSSSMLRSMKSSGVFAIMTFSSGPPNSNSA